MDNLKHNLKNILFFPFDTYNNWNGYSSAKKSVAFIALFFVIIFWTGIFHFFDKNLNLHFFNPKVPTKGIALVVSWFVCGFIAFYFSIQSKKNEIDVQDEKEIRIQRLAKIGSTLMISTTLFICFVGILHRVF